MFPLMLGVTLLLLMVQLQSFSRVALVFLTFSLGPMAITIMGGLLVATALTLRNAACEWMARCLRLKP